MSENPPVDEKFVATPNAEESTVDADKAGKEAKIASLKDIAVKATIAYWAKLAELKRSEGNPIVFEKFTNSDQWKAMQVAVGAYANSIGEPYDFVWLDLCKAAGHDLGKPGELPVSE